MLRLLLLLGGLLVLAAAGLRVGPADRAGRSAQAPAAPPDAEIPFEPSSYVVYRATGPVQLDGRLREADWAAVPWTDDFVDIEGSAGPAPRYRTRAKMLWDDRALYVAAELEDPDVWASLTERDAPVFRDNAFEVFLDPDGDSHNYYEFEVNAMGTIFDLLLVRPSRDGGPSVSAWDIRDLGLGLDVRGTLNDPSDRDEGWTVELAFPWTVLREAAPGRRLPRDGEQWRVNFARSAWPLRAVDGAYEKVPDAATGRPEANWWVWSPQAAVNMHKPERFGYVQFADVAAGAGTVPFVEDPNERVKWALRQLYYRQLEYHAAHGAYADRLADLKAGEITVEGMAFTPELRTTQTTYEITAPGAGGATVHIRHDGRAWTTQPD